MKTITGVPESITRARYLELMEAAGFTPKDLISLEFRRDGIYAVTYATTPNGKRVVGTNYELETHRVFIPVRD